jgi:hypothetical protein
MGLGECWGFQSPDESLRGILERLNKELPRNRGNPAASISWLVKGPQAFPRQAKELEMVWHQQQ